MSTAASTSHSDTVLLAQTLIQKPSVTPADEGCQQLLTDRLQPLGFRCEQMNRGGVTNLWATRGDAKPLLVFAGHTDVVPTGPLDQWRIPPFNGRIEDGMLHGRGAADMKGSIAAFVCACESFVRQYPEHQGAIGLLITSDEEGPATDGTVAVLDALHERDQVIDLCIVGEPTSTDRLGDVIKVGRRGSLGAKIQFHGVQGHIAYPHLASNPIHLALPALQELTGIVWDQGNVNFQPSSLQLSNIHGGTGATNVIPGTLEVMMNIRFSPEITDSYIRETVESLFTKHRLDYTIDWRLSGQPFETRQGELIEAVSASIESVTGYRPDASPSGGTSDGRFISPTGAQVIELGPINATIHKIDECISTSDLDLLKLCYQGALERLLVDR